MARGLAVDPAERFASADDYLAAVKAFLEGERDPDAVAAAARPARLTGQLAAPDPSMATTVFHGAPPPDALLAAAPPVPASVPLSPVAIEAGGGRVWRIAAIAGVVLGALVLIAMVLDRIGDRTSDSTGDAKRVATDAPAAAVPDPLAGLIEAWRADGLEPGRFAVHRRRPLRRRRLPARRRQRDRRGRVPPRDRGRRR